MKMLAAFDDTILLQAMEGLTGKSLLAFGVLCASRLIGSYERFSQETNWGSLPVVREALAFLWETACSPDNPRIARVRELRAACEAQVPDSEEYTSQYTSFAQDAVFSVCCLLDYCMDHEAQHIVLAARYATDSVDRYVQIEEQMVPDDATLELKILQHPLMQQELERQQRDLTLPDVKGLQETIFDLPKSS